MKTLATFLLSLVLPVCGQAADDAIVSTMGKGVGASAEEALKDSFRDAVERAVGVFVDAEQQAENDELIRDQILTQSNAYIENYSKVSEDKAENGLFKVIIVAKVKKAQLTRKLKDTMPTKTFSLGDELKREYDERQKLKRELAEQAEIDAEKKRQEAAKKFSKEKRDADAVALIKNTFKDFNPTAMMMDVTATGAKPAVEGGKGEVTVAFDLCLRLANERYFKILLPRLKQLFGQIALEKPTTVKFIFKRSDAEARPTRDFFDKKSPNVEMMNVPADSTWLPDVEIGGVACRLPACRLAIRNRMDIRNRGGGTLESPAVWLMDEMVGSGDQVRVTMIGYVLSESCIEALDGVTAAFANMGAVKFVADLIDVSGEVVTAQKFHVVQDCGWIGWGNGLKKGQDPAFYVMPWLTSEVEAKERFYKHYDQNGNFLGYRLRHVNRLMDSVPFRCRFKILEEELKSVSTIRVRAAE